MTTSLMAGPSGAPATADVEARARLIGRELFAEIGRGPSVWTRGWWDDRAMALSMDDPEVKVQLFRFIDALPALTRPETVGRHLREYLDQADGRVPWWMGLGVGMAPPGTLRGKALAGLARTSATHMARKFIAGSTPAEALRTVRRLRKRGVGFTADLLGEAVISNHEAESYIRTCVDLLRGLAGPLAREPEDPRIDRDQHGPIPRANLSLKLTSLTPRFDALYAESTLRRVSERLRPILRVAREVGAFVNVDMEQYAHKDLTYAIFRAVLSEPEFRDWADVGIVAQAYLPEAEADLHSLADWARDRGTPVTVRLVKGAYWDYETTNARQLGWPVPVYPEKWATDASFERCARFLMEQHETLRPALGSHNIRSLSVAIAGGRGVGRAQERLRDPDAPRHGRADRVGPGRPGLSGPGLYPVRGDAAGHGLPGPPAPGEHVQRVVPQGQHRRPGRRRRPFAQPRGGRSYAFVPQEEARPPLQGPGPVPE